MKSRLRVRVVIAAALLCPPFACAHMSDPCNDKLLNRTASPDGSLILVTYHRECRTAVYTVARVEKPAAGIRSKGEVVCYLMSWSDRHPIEATWKGGDTIQISTTDRLEKVDFRDSKDSCESGVKVIYSVQFRNERQQTDDPEVISRIRNVLADVGPCVHRFYGPGDGPVEYMNERVNNGEHRSAVELIMAYTSDAACPITPETYDALKELSEIFDVKPGYLERVARLRTSR